MPDEKAYALCWSKAGQEFKVLPLADLLGRNRRCYTDNVAPQDGAPIYVGPKSECETAARCAAITLAVRASADKVIAKAARRAA